MADDLDYQVSAPCLLDDLMDSHVISCDIDFGSTASVFGSTAASVFAVKASPSHESDSGCSDMSEDIRSVSPEFDHGAIGFPELEDLDCDSFSTDLDDELQSYLNAPLKLRSEKTPVSKINVEVRPAVATVLPSSPDMEIDDSDTDPDYEPRKMPTVKAPTVTRRPPVVHTKGGKRYIPNPAPQTDICVLQPKPQECYSRGSGRLSDNKNNVSQTPRPAVKVVKVIKTTAASTDDIGSQLMEALEERNQKNAKQAKINREKKKHYIQSLEEEIDGLKSENSNLKKQQVNVVSENKALQDEVEYLKSVLANQSALSGLLKNIGNVKGVTLSSSFSRKRSATIDHDYYSSKKAKKSGVCLHVDDGNVSLEFCSKCAKMAKSTESDEENS